MSKVIVLIVGPSGSGKSTLIGKTFENSQYIRSTATRDIRPGEVPGKDYIFTNKASFEKMLKNNELIQYAKYDGNYYGVTKEEIHSKLKEHDVVALPVVYPSVKDFKKFAVEEKNIKVIPVFTYISKNALMEHFKSRTDTPAQKKDRVSRYESELAYKKYFDDEHILNMDIDDHSYTASLKLTKLINKSLKINYGKEENIMERLYVKTPVLAERFDGSKEMIEKYHIDVSNENNDLYGGLGSPTPNEYSYSDGVNNHAVHIGDWFIRENGETTVESKNDFEQNYHLFKKHI